VYGTGMVLWHGCLPSGLEPVSAWVLLQVMQMLQMSRRTASDLINSGLSTDDNVSRWMRQN
jgi:hypothetical protein